MHMYMQPCPCAAIAMFFQLCFAITNALALLQDENHLTCVEILEESFKPYRMINIQLHRMKFLYYHTSISSP